MLHKQSRSRRTTPAPARSLAYLQSRCMHVAVNAGNFYFFSWPVLDAAINAHRPACKIEHTAHGQYSTRHTAHSTHHTSHSTPLSTPLGVQDRAVQHINMPGLNIEPRKRRPVFESSSTRHSHEDRRDIEQRSLFIDPSLMGTVGV